MDFSFNYFTPTQVVFGSGTEKRTGELVKKYGGKRVLVVYGGQSAQKSGLLDRVTSSLSSEGIEFFLLGGVVPNPLLGKVYEGIALAKEKSVDFLLAVGGGSVIDTAKAIGYGLANEGDVWDFYAYKRKASACLPVGAVLTIAAAGSEMSDSSVITNEKTGEKRGYSSDYARARFAVMNPELTLTVNDYQTQAGCADIMMHTMERYFTSGNKMEITDELAEGLLRCVKKNALLLKKNPKDITARSEVMWASSLAHNGLTGCGNSSNDFATHRLEHELGGMFDVTHGAGLTALWPSWARYVLDDCLDRFVRFAVNVMKVPQTGDKRQTALLGIESMEQFYREIGMPVTIKELGIEPSEEQIKEMAHRCHLATGGNLGSAKVLHEQDFYNIYKAANK